MFSNFDPHKPYFHSVALALILGGATLLAIGGAEWLATYWGIHEFTTPLLKMVAGTVITALGYIHLELELIRISRK